MPGLVPQPSPAPEVNTTFAFGSNKILPTKAPGASATPSPSLTGEGACKTQKDPDYFFEDGNIVIRVEDTLYKLHRSLLERHSPVFRELFTVPQPEGSSEGISDDNPIILSGIQATNFTRLLSLLYPPVLGTCPIDTLDEWMGVFEQADRWQMEYLRDCALARVRSFYISPIHKLLFWTRYNLPSNELIPAYMEIISRQHSLSLQEAEAVGLPMTVKIAQARDMVHQEGIYQIGKTGLSVRADKALGAVIKQIFGLPLSDSSSTPSTK